MPGTIEDYAAAVGNVIAINRDAEQGFRSAADAVNDAMLKELFERFSEERAKFAEELQAAVKATGFDPTHPSGVGGVVHGVWISIKGLFTGKDAHAILVEAERGEDWSVKTYRETLATNLPSELRPLIERQYEQVLAAHNQIRSLRDARAQTKNAAPTKP